MIIISCRRLATRLPNTVFKKKIFASECYAKQFSTWFKHHVTTTTAKRQVFIKWQQAIN